MLIGHKIKQFVANPTSGELNEIINELFTSDFIQFNVGSPNTYQSVIDLYSVVNQLIDWYHENDTLFSIDVQQVKKLARISLSLIHYRLYAAQNPNEFEQSIQTFQSIFSNIIQDDDILKSWSSLLTSYVDLMRLLMANEQEDKPSAFQKLIANLTKHAEKLKKNLQTNQQELKEILATYYSLLGLCYTQLSTHDRSQLQNAFESHYQALELRKQNEHLDIYAAISYCNLAKVCQTQGNISEAEKYFKASLTDYEAYDKEYPDTPMYLTPMSESAYLLGEFYFEQENPVAAIKSFLQSMLLETQYYTGDIFNYSCAVIYSVIKASLEQCYPESLPADLIKEIKQYALLDYCATPKKSENCSKLGKSLQLKYQDIPQTGKPLDKLLKPIIKQKNTFFSSDKNQEPQKQLTKASFCQDGCRL